MEDIKRAVVFCGAPVTASNQPPVPTDALYICADGGLLLAESCGVVPDILLGDFDSLHDIPTGKSCTVLQYPPEKDDTDAMLAAKIALENGCNDIVFYGALGGRLDHTFANLQMLYWLCRRGISAKLVDEKHIVQMQHNTTCHYPKRDGYYFSIFSFSETCTGVTLSSVKYPLQDGVLSSDFPLGVSNEIVAEKAIVAVENGTLLVLYARD